MLEEHLDNLGDDEQESGGDSDITSGGGAAPELEPVVDPFGSKGDSEEESEEESVEESDVAVAESDEAPVTSLFNAVAEDDDEEEPEPEVEVRPAAPLEPELPVNPKFKWYAVHTYSGHENKVRTNLLKRVEVENLEDIFGQVLVPTEEVTEMKQGKKSVTTRKFFPSYILVEMEMCDTAFHLVNQISGVTRFVGLDQRDNTKRPVALRKREVDRILGNIERPVVQKITEIPYRVGDHVKVIDGPFSDFNGVVDDVNIERGTLKVMVTIFGRETPVELDFLQVEPL
ncbi:MAG: transcription termination/antitermination factor NusG [bacterium]|nr:transcription termination/antitermination factor NusG [bacterium]